MAVDIFMVISTVNGESTDAQFPKSIQVASWHWGMTQSGNTHSSTGKWRRKSECWRSVIYEDRRLDESNARPGLLQRDSLRQGNTLDAQGGWNQAAALPDHNLEKYPHLELAAWDVIG